MNCTQCGSQVADNSTNCGNCGAIVGQPSQQYNAPNNQFNAQNNQYQNAGFVVPNTNGLLVLSIVTILFNILFGVLSLVFTLQAKKATSQETFDAAKKKAKILAIIGLVIGVLYNGFVIITAVMSTMTGAMYY